MAAASTETSHIADILRPFRAYWIIGRSAKASPPCNPKDCLYYTWKVMSRECRQVSVKRKQFRRSELSLGDRFHMPVRNEVSTRLRSTQPWEAVGSAVAMTSGWLWAHAVTKPCLKPTGASGLYGSFAVKLASDYEDVIENSISLFSLSQSHYTVSLSLSLVTLCPLIFLCSLSRSDFCLSLSLLSHSLTCPSHSSLSLCITANSLSLSIRCPSHSLSLSRLSFTQCIIFF